MTASLWSPGLTVSELNLVTPRSFGAFGGNPLQDDTLGLQLWLDSAQPKIAYNTTYYISDTLVGLGNQNIEFNNCTIVSSVPVALVFEGALTEIADLNTDPVRFGNSLNFATSHTLERDDVGIIYNPNDFSWMALNSYYREGEFFRVIYVPDANNVKIDSRLYWGYNKNNIVMYKMAKNEVNIRNLNIIVPGSGTDSCIKFRMCTKIFAQNLNGTNSDYTSFNLDRCFDAKLQGLVANVNTQAVPTKYAVSVGNSQRVRITDSSIYAVRHAVNIGGDNFDGAVPNRDIIIEGNFLGNDSDLTSVPCCDIHGNSEDIWYKGNTINGGISFGGRNCHYIDNNVRGGVALASSALAYGGSEWKGGIAEIRGGTLEGSAAYANGLVRLSNSANTTEKSTLIVKDLSTDCTSDTFARIDVTDATYKIDPHIKDITFLSSPILTQVLRCNGTGAGGDGDFLTVDGIEGAATGVFLCNFVNGYGANVKCKLQSQVGDIVIVTNNAVQAVNSALITYKYAYGQRTPKVTLANNTYVVGGTKLTSSLVSKTPLAMTLNIHTCTDGVNFGASGTNVTVNWHTEVNEQ